MSEMQMTKSGRSWTRAIPLLVIGVLFVALLASGVLRHISLKELAIHKEQLALLVARHPIVSLLGYMGLFALIVTACVPGPSLMAVAGGFLFGLWIGGAAALLAATFGGTIVFLACRTAFGDWAATRAGPMAAKIEAGFSNNAFSFLLAMRLMPVAPMFLVNIAAGLARIRLSTMILATLIGAAPASFIYAGLGAGVGEALHRHARLDVSLFARPGIVLPLAGLALISLTPALWRTIRARRS
jgi:uncharacterized membrane protein YdjX (TVP38/TMEM64 family)